MGEFLVIGFIQGAITAVMALGILLTFQTTGVLNLGFGALVMVAAYCYASLALSMNVWLAFAIVVGGAVVTGVLLGWVTLPAREALPPVKAVASLGLIPALQALVVLVWGTKPRATPVLATSQSFDLFGVSISTQNLLTIIIAGAACACLASLFRFGRTGSGLRAIAADTSTSRLIGLPVRRLWMLSWALCTAAAAVAAVLVVPTTGLNPSSLIFVTLPALAVVLAAQFRYPVRAVVIALLLGIADGILARDPDLNPYRGALPLALALGALLLVPSGRTGAWERV